jgi:hypothetical protein
LTFAGLGVLDVYVNDGILTIDPAVLKFGAVKSEPIHIFLPIPRPPFPTMQPVATELDAGTFNMKRPPIAVSGFDLILALVLRD